MKMSQTFPSKYLSAADLQDRPCNVVMAGCDMAEVGQSKDICPVVMFQGKEKGLVLNKTNGGIIAALHGDDTDGWVGKAIQVYPTTTEFGGKIVACIRVRVVPAGTTVTPAAAPPVDELPEIDDDGIPF